MLINNVTLSKSKSFQTMKNFLFLLLILGFGEGFGQNSEKFEGSYLLNGLCTVVSGPGAGYQGPFDPSQITIRNSQTGNILINFAGIDSVVAENKLDSFFIAGTSFLSGGCTTFLKGSGKIQNDTLFFQYFWGNTCSEGSLQYDCVGIKEYPNSVVESKKSKNVLNVYPVPANDQINFELDIPRYINTATIKILDSAGKLVKIVDLRNRGKFQENLDIKELQNGYFLAYMILDSRLEYTVKFIKHASLY